jgi:D-tagatose-1,6-bisphosphate aldolase subunit GatZ/KbaZ
MPHVLECLSESVRRGSPEGIYSVCSAHPLVLKAAAQVAHEQGTPLLIEATSNQVNQFGGYSGMRPEDFRTFALKIAAAEGFDTRRIVLGGDHLGPNPWSNQPASEAMIHAEEMVAEYSRAGFEKIHLDASMACEGESAPLPDSVVAERAARLCKAAEAAAAGQPRYYVIGTEVPVPGGATESLAELEVTPLARAQQTYEVHRKVFAAAGLSAVWPRVIALVVQPGVEFNHDSVVDYVPEKTVELRGLLKGNPGIVFEAHSSDYQRPAAYRELVAGGFSILKVGPALTFALREALFALENIEREIVLASDCSNLARVVEEEMLAHPANWQKHYHGTPDEQRILRRYSYSDRMRYYWGVPTVHAAAEKLFANLKGCSIPETLISAYLPAQYFAERAAGVRFSPEELAVFSVRQALAPYAAAGIIRAS